MESNMPNTLRRPSRRADRCRPLLERLESRLTLNASSASNVLIAPFDTSANVGGVTPLGPYLTPLSTDPANGAALTTSPSTVSVTFDRPIAPWTVSGADDLEVETLQGGTWNQVYQFFDSPAENLDDTGTILTLTLPAPLSPGSYRIVLPEFSSLGGLDGSTVADLGSDQILGSFTVMQPGVTLSQAQNLGTPGAIPLQVQGALELADNPAAVQLYKFTVAPGHHWRLAAEVDSSTLDSALALFDSNGALLATDNVGLPGSPGDAYLYAGLSPGTYYLGISGQGNLPNLPGGYDPVSGTSSTISQLQADGRFTLGIAIDQADAPVRLLGATLNFADPISANPTGLTLAFSGLLDLDTLRGDPTPGFYLANQEGQIFPMGAIASNETAAQYTFLFDQPLPAGQFTLYFAPKNHGGATDLAGDSPVALGQPTGVLGSFYVATGWSPSSPNDLGPLWDDVHQGIVRTDRIQAGATETYRFVVENNAPFQFNLTDPTGKATLSLRSALSLLPLISTNGGNATVQVSLKPGVYFLQLANPSKTPTTLTWRLQEVVSWEALLDNGIGQAPALTFRLVSPTTVGELSGTPWSTTEAWLNSGSSASGPFATSGASGGATTATGHEGGTGTGFGTSSVAPSGLLLTLGNTLVGRPTTETGRGADAIQAVAVELAANAPGYGQSITTSSFLRHLLVQRS